MKRTTFLAPQVALILTLSATQAENYTMSRSVTVNGSADAVWHMIGNFYNANLAELQARFAD